MVLFHAVSDKRVICRSAQVGAGRRAASAAERSEIPRQQRRVETCRLECPVEELRVVERSNGLVPARTGVNGFVAQCALVAGLHR